MISQNKGFTLVELAIVIVIIGLLVGGVLTGSALIEASKRNKVISEYKSYGAAVFIFKDKFKQMPGDFSQAYNTWGTNCDTSASDCNGDGDGFISSDITAANTNDVEATRAWQHMKLAGLVKGDLTGRGRPGWQSMGSAPIGPYDHSGYNLFYSGDGDPTRVPPTFGLKHYILIGNCTGPSGSARHCTLKTMSPESARSIDEKIDDGRPDTGRVAPVYGADNTNLSLQCKSGSEPNSTYSNVDTIQCILYMAIE